MGKIKFGIKNVHYAVATDDGTGALTYAKPVALPGAKSMTLSAEGDDTEEYADDGLWFKETSNNGYSGSIETEGLPDEFLTDVMGQTKNTTTGAITERSSDVIKEFALLFEFSFKGDAKLTSKRGVMYRCKPSRPDVAGSTKEKSISATTSTLNISAMPRLNDNIVQASAVNTDTAYSSWFEKVYEDPAETTTG
jgi:phi13 family phage major tail protein